MHYLLAFQLLHYLNSKTASVKEAFKRGTLTACPFSLPFSSGKISAIALADPVVVGIKLCMHPLALLKSRN